MDRSTEIFGTALKIDGTWYVRHQGGGGVLIPLEPRGELRDQLRDGQAYRFEGHIGKNRVGCPERCYANCGEAIGL